MELLSNPNYEEVRFTDHVTMLGVISFIFQTWKFLQNYFLISLLYHKPTRVEHETRLFQKVPHQSEEM